MGKRRFINMGKWKDHGLCVKCANPLRRGQVKYCSKTCTWEDQREKRKQISESNRRRTCLACGRLFIMPYPSSRARRGEDKAGLYCSRKCRWVHYRSEHQKIEAEKNCRICGVKITNRRKSYCSDECRREQERQGYHSNKEVILKKLREKYRAENNVPDLFQCRECGKEYIRDENGDHRRYYCSTKCMDRSTSRNHNHIRRMRLRKNGLEIVYRSRIYERDNYKCQICGKKVLMNKISPHPLSPTIDHIIPLVSGGTHEPTNVRLCHFMCNVIKGGNASTNGDQLLLFG